jgi:hypothetical protein
LRGLGFKERKGKPAAFYMTKKQTTAEIVAEL